MITQHTTDRQPAWWTIEYTLVWLRAEPLLKADFERAATNRYRAELKRQGVDDDVHHAAGVGATPRNVAVDHASEVPDEDWELGVEWDQVRPALRFGVGARANFPTARWTQELEARLKDDYCKTYDSSTWEKMKRTVRRGFEFDDRERPS